MSKMDGRKRDPRGWLLPTDRVEVFWSRVMPEPNSGCWLWMGHVLPNGYPTFRIGTKNVYAYRYSYVLHGGVIPDGYEVDHKCCNPVCVNPAHLEAVTPRENSQRTWRRGRGKRPPYERNLARLAAMTHCKRGHPLSGGNLGINSTSGNRFCKTCQKITAQRSRERNREQREARAA